MERLYQQFMRIIGLVCAFMFCSMFVVSLLQVICRYIFNNSLTWSEELARYLFVWVSARFKPALGAVKFPAPRA